MSPVIKEAVTKPVLTEVDISKVLNAYHISANKNIYSECTFVLKCLPQNEDVFDKWIIQLTKYIHNINSKSLPFIQEFLSVPWFRCGQRTQKIFTNFVISIVTTHNFLTVEVYEALFKVYDPSVYGLSKELQNPSNPGEIINCVGESIRNICSLIKAVVSSLPVSSRILLMILSKSKPFPGRNFGVHIANLYKMLTLCQIMPDFAPFLLDAVFDQMISIDLNIQREELEHAQNNDIMTSQFGGMKLHDEIVNTFDTLMSIMLRYIHGSLHSDEDILKMFDIDSPYECNPADSPTPCSLGSVSKSNKNTKGCCCWNGRANDIKSFEMFSNVKNIFFNRIIAAYSSSHVQYLIYYFLAIRPESALEFIDLLRANVESPNNSLEIRRNASAYIGSLLARATFISYDTMYACILLMSDWCKSYLNKEKFVISSEYDFYNHGSFYYACQVIFYVFSFRHEEFTKDNRRLERTRALQFDYLINSSLNPLLFCPSKLRNQFAAISFHYQVAYCYNVIENNERILPTEVLEDKLSGCSLIFPFEPYLLPKSKIGISNHYRELEELPSTISISAPQKIENDANSSYNFLSCSPDMFDSFME